MVLGYFILIFGQKPFFMFVKFPFLVNISVFPIFLHNHGIILYDFGVILKIKFSLSDCCKGVKVTKCI